MKKYIAIIIVALAGITSPIFAADPLPPPSIDAPLGPTKLDDLIDIKACLEDCKAVTDKAKSTSLDATYKDWTFADNKKFADLPKLEQGAIKLHAAEEVLREVLIARFSLLKTKAIFAKFPESEQKVKDAKLLEEAQTKWKDAHTEIEVQHKKIISEMIANNKDPKLAIELKSYQKSVEELYKNKK